MMRMWSLAGALVAVSAMLCGCGGVSTPEKTYEIKTVSGLDQAKQILQHYAEGAPLGSEVTSFPQIVEEVKKEDPQKAAVLEQGLAELQRSPSTAAAKAKVLLGRL